MKTALVVLLMLCCATVYATPGDDPDQAMARRVARDARAGRETRVTTALADLGKGRTAIRRERIVKVFTDELGAPIRRGTLLVWKARRTLTVEPVPMSWGEILRITVE